MVVAKESYPATKADTSNVGNLNRTLKLSFLSLSHQAGRLE